MTNVMKSNVYCADFETTSVANLERDGCVRVWLWSLVNVKTKRSLHGSCIESFLSAVKKVGAKIVFFPQSTV